MKKVCKICKQEFVGRLDKIFCSINCKNVYNTSLSRVTKNATVSIDKILHRNRSILLEIMGKSAYQKKVPRSLLDNGFAIS